MLLGPVFTAEMVTAARRRRYFALRLLFAAGLLLLLWTCCLGVRNGRDIGGELTLSESSELATAFFMSFSWITLTVTLLVVPAIAAGTIATERDRRTIEYLFATDLSNAEIVLSKLVAKVLLVGKLLIVALPVIAIFRLLGGIPGDLLLAFYVILASTSLLLVMLSMSISVWTTRARDALTRVYLLLVAVLVIPTILWLWMSALQASGVGLGFIIDPIKYVCEFFTSINPLWVYGQAISGGGALGFSLDQSAIWRMAGIHVAISAVLATISVLAVRRVHLNAVSASTRETKGRRTREVGAHPMLWKECFAKSAATKLGWIGRAALLLIVVVSMGVSVSAFVAAIYYSNQWQPPWEQFMGVTATMSSLYGSGVVLLVGVRAAGLVSYEKERDCWLSLLSTPLSASEIVGGKVVGNLYAFRWLPLPLAFTWLLQIVLFLPSLFAAFFTLLMLLVTCLFASTVGVAFSLKFNTTLKSIGATMGVLIMVGGGYVMCCCVPVMIGGGDDDFMKIAFSLVIPFLLAIPAVTMFDGGNEIEWFVADYCIGLFAYGIATAMIYQTCRQSFDQMVGRTVERYSSAALPSTTSAGRV